MSFLNDLRDRATQVMTILEESQVERSDQLVNFAKMFKVLCQPQSVFMDDEVMSYSKR